MSRSTEPGSKLNVSEKKKWHVIDAAEKRFSSIKCRGRNEELRRRVMQIRHQMLRCPKRYRFEWAQRKCQSSSIGDQPKSLQVSAAFWKTFRAQWIIQLQIEHEGSLNLESGKLMNYTPGAPASRSQAPLRWEVSPYRPNTSNFIGLREGIIRVPENRKWEGRKKNLLPDVSMKITLW